MTHRPDCPETTALWEEVQPELRACKSKPCERRSGERRKEDRGFLYRFYTGNGDRQRATRLNAGVHFPATDRRVSR